jgi:hypothetical protein
VLVGAFGWLAIFLGRVPLGVLTVCLALIWLREHAHPHPPAFDLHDAVLLFVGLVTVVLCLTLGGLSQDGARYHTRKARQQFVAQQADGVTTFQLPSYAPDCAPMESLWKVVENMLAGYTFIDKALSDGTDLLVPRHIACLLERNHLVLCGLEPHVRQEYHTHIAATTQRFYEQMEFNINDILRWYDKRAGTSAWKRAADVYVRILSQPQLYIEGNHRPGALIMSYILARAGKAPFVLSVHNAKAYFNPSTLVKNTKKNTTTLLMKLPRIKLPRSKLRGIKRKKTLPRRAASCGESHPARD